MVDCEDLSDCRRTAMRLKRLFPRTGIYAEMTSNAHAGHADGFPHHRNGRMTTNRKLPSFILVAAMALIWIFFSFFEIQFTNLDFALPIYIVWFQNSDIHPSYSTQHCSYCDGYYISFCSRIGISNSSIQPPPPTALLQSSESEVEAERMTKTAKEYTGQSGGAIYGFYVRADIDFVMCSPCSPFLHFSFFFFHLFLFLLFFFLILCGSFLLFALFIITFFLTGYLFPASAAYF